MTGGVAVSGDGVHRGGAGRGPAEAAPSPQVTDEFGCTLTGPAGSTPVTVSSSDVHVMPTDDASAALASDVEVPGPGRAAAATPCRRPSSPCPAAPFAAWRAKPTGGPGSIRCSVTDFAPYTVTGATITGVSSRNPALDSVTSSSSACRPERPGPQADHRRRCPRTRQRHRVPLPNAKRCNGFRMQPNDAATRVDGRGVQARGQGQ